MFSKQQFQTIRIDSKSFYLLILWLYLKSLTVTSAKAMAILPGKKKQDPFSAAIDNAELKNITIIPNTWAWKDQE